MVFVSHSDSAANRDSGSPPSTAVLHPPAIAARHPHPLADPPARPARPRCAPDCIPRSPHRATHTHITMHDDTFRCRGDPFFPSFPLSRRRDTNTGGNPRASGSQKCRLSQNLSVLGPPRSDPCSRRDSPKGPCAHHVYWPHAKWIGNEKLASRPVTPSAVDSRALQGVSMRQSNGAGLGERSSMIANIAVRIAAVRVGAAESATGLDFGVRWEPALKFFDGDYCERESSVCRSLGPAI